MRFLFSVPPLPGHFHPLVPIAKAARDAGHDVAFAVSPLFRSTVERVGFRAFPAGDDFGQERTAHPALARLTGREFADYFWQHIFAGDLARAVVRDLPGVVAAWRPDLIVRCDTEFGGLVVAERLGIPHATIQTVAFRPRMHALIAAPLNALRVSLGLAADPDLAMLYRYLFVSPRPPSFADPAAPLPPTTHVVRSIPFDQSGEERLPPWVEQRRSGPLVYVTLGTSSTNRRDDIFQAFTNGLRDEPVSLIVTIGRDRDLDSFGPQPPHIHIEPYVPQSLLFPHCDVIVSHAGSGTLFGALAHGLPQVLVPIQADQPENAERAAALGLACVVDVKNLNPAVAREAVLTVLRDPTFRSNARRIQAEIAALPGTEMAVRLLERLAVEKLPLVGLVKDAGKIEARRGSSPSPRTGNRLRRGRRPFQPPA